MRPDVAAMLIYRRQSSRKDLDNEVCVTIQSRVAKAIYEISWPEPSPSTYAWKLTQRIHLTQQMSVWHRRDAFGDQGSSGTGEMMNCS